MIHRLAPAASLSAGTGLYRIFAQMHLPEGDRERLCCVRRAPTYSRQARHAGPVSVPRGLPACDIAVRPSDAAWPEPGAQ